jgi:hypothetical protein
MYIANYYKVQTKVNKRRQAATGNTPPHKVNDINYSILYWQTVER